MLDDYKVRLTIDNIWYYLSHTNQISKPVPDGWYKYVENESLHMVWFFPNEYIVPSDVKYTSIYIKDGKVSLKNEAEKIANKEMFTTFPTGAVRVSSETPLYNNIPPSVLRRIALIFNEGAKHYGEDNWQKGLPWKDTYNHMVDHLMKYCEGSKEEDSLAKVAWGCIVQMWYDENNVETK